MAKLKPYISYLDIAIPDLKIGDIILCENKKKQQFVATIMDIVATRNIDDFPDTGFVIDWYDDLAETPKLINLPSFSARVFRSNLLNMNSGYPGH